MTPLVSVIIPCYNAVQTLPWTLASLLAQTYSNWECIIVDDGSTDRPIEVVETVNDDRIRFHRFDKNRGRAAARQHSLDLAQGDYLCMIDADDWIYPWKIERQVTIMEEHAELSILSTGMAIVDKVNNILSVRMSGSQSNDITAYPPLQKPLHPPFAHAPSMIRMNIAKETAYDLQFTIAEDMDFLLRIILKYPFGVLSDITYVYNEIGSYGLGKMMQSMNANHKMFSKYKQAYPYSVYKNYVKLFLKQQIYRISFAFGVDNYLVKRRSKQPTQGQIDVFQNARRIVCNTGTNVFAGSLYENAFNSLAT